MPGNNQKILWSVAISIVCVILTALISFALCYTKKENMAEAAGGDSPKYDGKVDPKDLNQDKLEVGITNAEKTNEFAMNKSTVFARGAPNEVLCPGDLDPLDDGGCYGQPESGKQNLGEYTEFESTYTKVIGADTGACAAGMSVLANGMCVGKVENMRATRKIGSINPGLFATPLMKSLNKAGNSVMEHAGFGAAQKKIITEEVNKMVEAVSAEYNKEPFVKKLAVDGFANVIRNSRKIDNFAETMRAVTVGLGTTMARKELLKKIAMREHFGMKTNMRPAYRQRRKGLHEYFEPVTGAVSGKPDLAADAGTPSTVDYAHEIADAASVDAQNDYMKGLKADYDLCEDGTTASGNVGGTCYAKANNPAEDPLNSAEFAAAETLGKRMAASDLCEDGSYIGFDGATSCYAGVERDDGKPNENDMYPYETTEATRKGWNFCPNNEYLREIDQCPAVPEEQAMLDFNSQMANSGKHLHERLFPGPQRMVGEVASA